LKTCVYQYLSNTLLSILGVYIYSKLELLDYMLVLFLISWGTIMHTVFQSCYTTFIDTNSEQGYQSLHILANSCYFLSLFFDSRHLNECEMEYTLVYYSSAKIYALLFRNFFWSIISYIFNIIQFSVSFSSFYLSSSHINKFLPWTLAFPIKLFSLTPDFFIYLANIYSAPVTWLT
jgi:hypothetical protein